MNATKTFPIVLTALAVFALSGCQDLSNREDFESAMKSKTESEVVKYAGKPADIDRSDPNHVKYVYKSRTFDVATRATDSETDVIFTPSPDGQLHVAQVVFK
jgi:hypothetical protein